MTPEEYQPTPEEIKAAEAMLSKKQRIASAQRKLKYQYGGADKSNDPGIESNKTGTPKISGTIGEQLSQQGINPGQISAESIEAARDREWQRRAEWEKTLNELGAAVEKGVERHDEWAKSISSPGVVVKIGKENAESDPDRLKMIRAEKKRMAEIHKQETGRFPAQQEIERRLLNAMEQLEMSKGMKGEKSAERTAHYQKEVASLMIKLKETDEARERRRRFQEEKAKGKKSAETQKGQASSLNNDNMSKEDIYKQNEAERIAREQRESERFDKFAEARPEFVKEIEILRKLGYARISEKEGSEEAMTKNLENVRKRKTEELVSKERELTKKYLAEERAKLDPVSRLDLFIKENPKYAGLIAKMREGMGKRKEILGILPNGEEAFSKWLEDIEKMKQSADQGRDIAEKTAEAGTKRAESTGGTPEEIGQTQKTGGRYVEGVKMAGEEAEKATVGLNSGLETQSREGPPPPPPGRRSERGAEEPPLDCYDFGSCCEKASDAVKRFAKKLYEGVRMKTVNRAKIWFNEKIYNWHDKKSRKYVGQVSAFDRQITGLENQIKEHEEGLSRRFANASAASRERIFSSIQKMRRDVEKLTADKEKAQSRLNNRDNEKRRYENKQKDNAAEALGRIADGLRPYELKIAARKKCKEQYDVEISSHAARKKEFQAELEALRREMAGAPKEVKKAIKEEIALIQAEIKRAEKNIKNRVKARQEIEKQLTKLERGASYWRDARNEFSRIANRERAYYAKKAKKPIVEADLARKEISAGGGEEAAPAERKEIKKIRPLSERINEWNDHFRTAFPLSAVDLRRAGVITGERDLLTEDFVSILNDYYVFLSGEGEGIPSERELDDMIAALRGWEMGR